MWTLQCKAKRIETADVKVLRPTGGYTMIRKKPAKNLMLRISQSLQDTREMVRTTTPL
jgi:hypothetical protein